MMKFNLILRWLILLFCFFVFVPQSYGQTLKITGTVMTLTDRTPVVGATVVIQGKSKGTVTNAKGTFTLEVPKGAKLVISSMGYKSVEQIINNSKPLEIFLEEDAIMMEEVVAIGYGHARRSDVTGAVASLGTEDIEGRVATSIDDLLRGRIAGVKITSSDGAPGAGISVRIRGGTSINASSEPLYVIDGFPIMNNTSDVSMGSMGGIGGTTNPLAELNPEDIESINILKDASATAIYGSRGANGVVLITTKQADKGKTRVSYSGYYSVSLRPQELPVLSNKELQLFKNEKSRYASSPTGNNIFDNNRWMKYVTTLDSLSQVDWSAQNNTNWQRAIFRLGHTTKHQISVTGGSESTSYIVTGDYMNVAGVVKNTDLERFNGRFNVQHKIRKWLTFGTNNTFSWMKHNGITQANGSAETNGTGIFVRAARYSPDVGLEEIKFFDDEEGGEDDETIPSANPYVLLRDAVLEKLSRSFITNNTLTFNIARGLSFKSSLGARINAVKQSQYFGSTTGIGKNVNGKARIGSIDMVEFLNENILTYNRTFRKKHSINVMAGMTLQSNRKETYQANAQNFPYEGLGLNDISIGTEFVQPKSNVGEWSLMSFLGRVNYGYKDRYLFTASLRADGSSRFAPGHQWGYFPSAAFAWRISEEKFLKNSRVISNLKLRTSYGQTGNQEIGLNRSKAIYSLSTLAFNDAITPAFYLNNVANDNLTWETTNQFDAGLEAGFFNNRLSLSVDYYYKVTHDLLLSVPTAISSGFSSTLMNIGKVLNRGVEVTLNAQILAASRTENKLGWDFDLNFATNKNMVLSLGSTNYFYKSLGIYNTAKDHIIVKTGEPLGSWFGYQTDGIFQYGDPDLEKFTTVQGTTPAAGDWKFVDQDHNNVINEDDRVVLGNSQPKFYGGFSTGFTFRNFDLRFMFEYSYGAKIFNGTRSVLEDMASNENRSTTISARWVGPDWETNPDGTVKLVDGQPVAIPGTGNPSNTMPRAGYTSTYQMQDSWLEDGSYLRLSNVKLTYSLPRKFNDKIGIRSASVYVSASNLWLWTRYSGSDPEVNIDPDGYGSMIAGYDYDAYPRCKMITFGFNFSF